MTQKQNRVSGKKKSFSRKVTDNAKRWYSVFRNSAIIISTLKLSLSILLILGGLVGGFIHKKGVERERALTISDIDQELSFALTGSTLMLREQYRNKDVTIVPFKIDSGGKMSMNAADYKIGLRYVDGDPLPSDLKTSFVMFGGGGEGAIVLRGSLEKKPMFVIVRNDNIFAENAPDKGMMMYGGSEVEVDYNGVGFNINPKGNNVVKKEAITDSMTANDLYKVAYGTNQHAKIEADMKAAKEDLEKVERNMAERKLQIENINKSLGRDKNDMRLDDSSGVDEDTAYTDYDDTKDFSDVDLSVTDLKGIRANMIGDYESLSSDKERIQKDMDRIENKRKSLNDFMTRVESISTVNNKYERI